MTAARGVRYLLRNGLDYINYQQYDRALKFLREAETRGKELNDAEKLALKQGIERAQRGLREASNAQSPYAVSERSGHRNGFNPAKPDSQVVSNTDPLGRPARRSDTDRPSKNNVMGSEGEDQGEPIRLASGEVASNDQPLSQSDNSSRSTRTRAKLLGAEQPVRMPEIPKLPSDSQLADPMDTGAMPSPSGAADQGMVDAAPKTARENTTLRRPGVADAIESAEPTPPARPAI